jgi:BirA family biotin operon repressor/biotin-[acetyl-CoA-carboxylase] ligase
MSTDLTPDALRERLAPLLASGQADLSQLGLSEEELRVLGFEVSNGQVRVPGDIERLDVEAIAASLSERAKAWLTDLQVLAVVGSTNTLLGELAAANAAYGGAQGAVRIAELQVQGRGRRGRNWQSPFGQNLALSLGVRLPLKPEALGGYSLCTGLAVADALQSVGVPDVTLKWPNDVLVRGRKISGILVEIFAAGPATDVIVGIGINFRIPIEARREIDQPVIDLEDLGGGFSRNQLAGALISSLIDFSEGFAETGFAPMRSAFDKQHHFHGETCTLLLGDERLSGSVRGVTQSGELELLVDGQIRTFSAGEVSLRPS